MTHETPEATATAEPTPKKPTTASDSLRKALARRPSKTPTRKQEQRNTEKLLKSLADQNTFDKQLSGVLLGGYRECVKAYFGADLPGELVDLMNRTISEELTKGTVEKKDVDVAPALRQLVADFKSAMLEPLAEPTLEELAQQEAQADLAQEGLGAKTAEQFAEVFAGGVK